MNVIIIVMYILYITRSKSRLTYETALGQRPRACSLVRAGFSRCVPWCEQGSRLTPWSYSDCIRQRISQITGLGSRKTKHSIAESAILPSLRLLVFRKAHGFKYGLPNGCLAMMNPGHRIIVDKLDTSRIALIQNVLLHNKLRDYRERLPTLFV